MTYEGVPVVLRPRSMIVLGLLMMLLAIAIVSSHTGTSITDLQQKIAPVEISSVNLDAPPPYCPQQPSGNPGQGNGPPSTNKGKGDPGSRQRPCGPNK